MSDLIERIKNHRLVPIASIYLVAGWVLLQLGDVTLEPLGMPEWTQTALILAVVSGFPLALIGAWFLAPQKSNETVPPVTADENTCIAVLPFWARDDQNDELLARGIAEAAIVRLSSIESLQVISRVSAFRFSSQQVDLELIRQQLRITHLITGSIRRDNRLHVVIDCTRLADETNAWSLALEFGLNEPRVVEVGVAQAIAERYQSAPSEAAAITWQVSPAAYQQYLLATHEFRQSQYRRAAEHAKRSIELDSNNPLAECLLSEIYIVWSRIGYFAIPDQLHQARRHLKRCNQLAPDYAPQTMIEATLALYFERDMERAVSLSEVLLRERLEQAGYYARFLGYAGYMEDAAQTCRRLLETDPLNLYNQIMLHRLLRWLGDDEQAEIVHSFCLEIGAGSPMVQQDAIEKAIAEGRLDDAFEQTFRGLDPNDLDNLDTGQLFIGNKIIMRQGNEDLAIKMAETLAGNDRANPTRKATAYLNCHLLDPAFQWWGRAIERYDPGAYQLAFPFNVRTPREEIWIPFAADPRYQECQRRLGIDDESLTNVPWLDIDKIIV